MKKSILLAALGAAILPLTTMAHEGHGNVPGSNPLHYAAEPMHVAVVLVAVSAIAGLIYRFSKQSKKS